VPNKKVYPCVSYTYGNSRGFIGPFYPLGEEGASFPALLLFTIARGGALPKVPFRESHIPKKLRVPRVEKPRGLLHHLAEPTLVKLVPFSERISAPLFLPQREREFSFRSIHE
jgi:hypothetical protein